MIKVGLIGCGFFAVNQVQGWADAEGACVTAICDRDPDRLATMGARFGIAQRFDDAARMMREADLDVVDIATTVPSHRPLVMAAAEAGLHAICQEALCRDAGGCPRHGRGDGPRGPHPDGA